MSAQPRPTRYDPGADDPRIVAALAARRRLDEALATGGVETLQALFADELVLQTPGSRVVDKPRILAAYAQGGRETYQDGLTLILDFVGVRRAGVVMMGEERVGPPAPAPPIRRRFTDIWTEIDGQWRLTVRQATNVAAGV